MSLITKTMTAKHVEDAFHLLNAFLSADEHYLDSSAAYGDGGSEALRAALGLFLSRPDLGFIWLAYDSDMAVACCVVCYAISTSTGAIVVKLDDVTVKSGYEGQGIGTVLIDTLKAELRRQNVKRIDTSCHLQNPRARAFYVRHGFTALNEERFSHVL